MALFTPFRVGNCALSNRVVMSAMTRTRMDPATDLPNDLVATYYEQRSNPGSLIISEGSVAHYHIRPALDAIPDLGEHRPASCTLSQYCQ